MKKMRQYIVIDDDSTNNLICKFIIKKFDEDAEIILYQEPEKALKYISKNFPFDEAAVPVILFLDVNMPTMSGFEFLDEFKKFPSEIKNKFLIYMLTSSIEDFEEQGKLYPVVAGFLSKPLKISYLNEIHSEPEYRLVINNFYN